MTEYLTSSPEETEAVGEKLAAALAYRPFAFVALYGELGVGKTAFVRGFCRVFGIDRVKSPTFTVVNEYRGTKNVFHMAASITPLEALQTPCQYSSGFCSTNAGAG